MKDFKQERDENFEKEEANSIKEQGVNLIS